MQIKILLSVQTTDISKLQSNWADNKRVYLVTGERCDNVDIFP